MLHCWSFLGNRNMKQFSWCSCRTSRQQPIVTPTYIYIYIIIIIIIITSIYLATMFIICPVHLMFDIPFDYPSCWLLDDMTLLDLQGPWFGPWLRSADDMISFLEHCWSNVLLVKNIDDDTATVPKFIGLVSGKIYRKTCFLPSNIGFSCKKSIIQFYEKYSESSFLSSHLFKPWSL